MGGSWSKKFDEWWRSDFLMHLPGRSELKMSFRAEDEVTTSDLSVVVSFQVGGRGYLPSRGEASLETWIDGRLIDGGRALFTRAVGDSVTTLPLEVLTPGEHVLMLRLSETSNTTFRVHSVPLVAPQ